MILRLLHKIVTLAYYRTPKQNEIHHNKENDLEKFRVEIKSALEEEIASRYYLSRGMIEATFDKDTQLIEAIKVLNEPERYNQILAKSN